MKKVLIATNNKSKFHIVKNLLIKAGFNEEEYIILNLYDINYTAKDEKESGSISERAYKKALEIKENMKKNDFEYIIGIDDGIELKGQLQPNVKEYIQKILYEKYLKEGENFAFIRAYAILSKDGNSYETTIRIPYIYKEKKYAEVKPNSYPLSQISVPIGFDKPVAELSEEEAHNYTWLNSKEALSEVIKKIII